MAKRKPVESEAVELPPVVALVELDVVASEPEPVVVAEVASNSPADEPPVAEPIPVVPEYANPVLAEESPVAVDHPPTLLPVFASELSEPISAGQVIANLMAENADLRDAVLGGEYKEYASHKTTDGYALCDADRDPEELGAAVVSTRRFRAKSWLEAQGRHEAYMEFDGFTGSPATLAEPEPPLTALEIALAKIAATPKGVKVSVAGGESVAAQLRALGYNVRRIVPSFGPQANWDVIVQK